MAAALVESFVDIMAVPVTKIRFLSWASLKFTFLQKVNNLTVYSRF
jgi:hypothetical protein